MPLVIIGVALAAIALGIVATAAIDGRRKLMSLVFGLTSVIVLVASRPSLQAYRAQTEDLQRMCNSVAGRIQGFKYRFDEGAPASLVGEARHEWSGFLRGLSFVSERCLHVDIDSCDRILSMSPQNPQFLPSLDVLAEAYRTGGPCR